MSCKEKDKKYKNLLNWEGKIVIRIKLYRKRLIKVIIIFVKKWDNSLSLKLKKLNVKCFQCLKKNLYSFNMRKS